MYFEMLANGAFGVAHQPFLQQRFGFEERGL
jgi:hypothetical protein